MSGAGSRPVGVDFSIGMLRVARRAAPGVPLVQADLNQRFPVREGAFDAVLTALVSEHLTDLGLFFREAFVSLRAGGRLVFSAFHPELALSGVEANFEHDGTEYRLGAELHTVDDYLNRIVEAGFREPRLSEYRGDATLARTVPGGVKYEGRAVLLLIEATRPL
jgi:SAM-dependent methyltransferase